MPTAKKSSSKRTAMRDIAIKKPKEEESFTVHRITSKVETPTIEPLRNNDFQQNAVYEDDTYEDRSGFNQSQEIENAIEEAMPSDDFFNQVDSMHDQDEPVATLSTVQEDPEPKDFVRVKFAKFVQLVASHDFDEVVQNNANEDVVLSSNLLTDLAGAHDEREEKKVPLVFLIGLAIGVVLTYILLTK